MERELQLILDNLDFSGSRSSWFDHWSTGFDWEGEGNSSDEKRTQYLKQMLKFYNEAKARLQGYPKDYQLWMEISEGDSSMDAVFIHTENPNKTPFPLKYETKKSYHTKSESLNKFISKSRLSAVELFKGGMKVILLFDPQAGIPPVK